MKVAFHSGYLGFRGTEVALIDYAWGNKEILGNESFFLLPWRDGGETHPVVATMRNTAPVRFYRSKDEMDGILKEEATDFFYCVKNGFNDGVFSSKVLTGVHAIFRESEFHGDIYAYISQWLSDVMSHGKAPVAPWMIRLAETKEHLRGELGIPPEACVFGRHGGDDSFDIPWVKEAVLQTAKAHPDVWFIFLNTKPFHSNSEIPNLIFLPGTADALRKRAFLNTCDAMIHGRERGETLGLACMEFAAKGKKVLTYVGSPEQAHLGLLGNAAMAYADKNELVELLQGSASDYRLSIAHQAEINMRFGSHGVMEKFRQIFLS